MNVEAEIAVLKEQIKQISESNSEAIVLEPRKTMNCAIVGFDSEADTIELKHTARSREGFALGAVRAAEWIYGKSGFFSNDSAYQTSFLFRFFH